MEVKMEKDNESMVVKQEYASSEFSEAPPAYKNREASSVKIAKIVAFTVLVSSFILGSFILASTYMQIRASCDQVSALDKLLEKELLLESMQQDLPKPEPLLSQNINEENNVQDLSKDQMNKPNSKDQTNLEDVETIDDDEDVKKRIHVKLPMDFDLSEIAHNILMNNQKSRMNCVVERRRTEEVEEPKNPFINFSNEPKKKRVTGERLSIFCETGEPKTEQEPIRIRQIVMPLPINNVQFPPVNHPRFPPQFPTPQDQMNFRMPQMRIPFHQFSQQLPQLLNPPRPEVPQFRLINPMPQEIPNFTPQQQKQPESYGRPQEVPKPEMRVQLRRIEIPGPIGDIIPFLNNIRNEAAKENEMPRQNVQIQQIPLEQVLSKVGISPDDLKNIQRMAEDKFQEHIRELVADEDDSESESNQSEEEESAMSANSSEQKQESAQNLEPEALILSRSNFGRSLNPVQLPGNAEIHEAERADFVHPR